MSKQTGRPLRFTSLRLENWRNFREVDVELRERVFLVGPNASGKSNLLDAFRFLRDLARSGGGFQEAVERRGGVSSLRCLAARQNPAIGIEVSVGNNGEDPEWSYLIRFTYDSRKRRPVLKEEEVRYQGTAILKRPDDREEGDPELLTQTAIEQVAQNRDFRDLAGFLETVRYLHIVPQLVREPERSVGYENDPYGGDFLERVGRTSQRTRDAHLKKIVKALRVAVPQLSELEPDRDDRGAWHLRGKYRHWRKPGKWQNESDFSDGTLRLLGLLWAVLDGKGPLLLEEPELSLHPGVVQHLAQMFARMQTRGAGQIILSTQSADLLRDEGIGLDEVLLLEPETEGTVVRVASAIEEARVLLEAGIPLGDVVVPRTQPPDAVQLALFGS